MLSWLVLSFFLFSTGIYGVLTRRNAVGILIAVELMLNSGAMNFVVFNSFLSPKTADGQIMSIFVIAIAAAEVLVGMAILIMLYGKRRTMDVTKLDLLKH